MKVKIFCTMFPDVLENRINDFIKDKKEFTIQYAIDNRNFSAMIIYKEIE